MEDRITDYLGKESEVASDDLLRNQKIWHRLGISLNQILFGQGEALEGSIQEGCHRCGCKFNCAMSLESCSVVNAGIGLENVSLGKRLFFPAIFFLFFFFLFVPQKDKKTVLFLFNSFVGNMYFRNLIVLTKFQSRII